jgi:hypothetical protein
MFVTSRRSLSPRSTDFHPTSNLSAWISSVLPVSRFFDLILSFPLLEDLTVIAFDATIENGDGSDGMMTIAQPPKPTRAVYRLS